MDRETSLMRRALLAVAIVAGAVAPFARSPYRTDSPAQFDIGRLAAAVEAEEDHVTAIELARWIRDRKPGLRVIDLRSASEFDAYHVPSATNVPLPALIATPPAKRSTIVLVSEGGAHAAQGWVFLRAMGHDDVYFLRGGLQEWLDDVMSPVNAAPEVAELSRYFGGTPSRSDTPGSESASERVRTMRRRGC
jgi:rhodanese-related sulfurtransferase